MCILATFLPIRTQLYNILVWICNAYNLFELIMCKNIGPATIFCTVHGFIAFSALLQNNDCKPEEVEESWEVRKNLRVLLYLPLWWYQSKKKTYWALSFSSSDSWTVNIVSLFIFIYLTYLVEGKKRSLVCVGGGGTI